ncbi:hypothetical protein FKM82_007198 [Ascaphus truei]
MPKYKTIFMTATRPGAGSCMPLNKIYAPRLCPVYCCCPRLRGCAVPSSRRTPLRPWPLPPPGESIPPPLAPRREAPTTPLTVACTLTGPQP